MTGVWRRRLRQPWSSVLIGLLVIVGLWSSATAQENLLTNSGFEAEATAAGNIPAWPAWRSPGPQEGFIRITSEQVYEGTQALHFVDATTLNGFGLEPQPLPASPGERYEARVMAYVNKGRAGLWLIFYDQNRRIVGREAIYLPEQGEWLELRAEGVAPPEATSVTLRLYSTTADEVDVVYDAARLVRLSAATEQPEEGEKVAAPAVSVPAAEAAPSRGRVLYVAPHGSDDAPGTREQPWATPAKAGREAKAGDTVIFLPGSYSGILQPRQSGTPDAPIRFVAAERRTARLTGLPGTEAIRLIGVEHIQVEGFHLRPEADVEGSLLIHNAAHPTLANPMARAVGSWIRIQNASYIHITDLLMEETPVSNPFSITGSEHIYVRDSVMRGNTHNMVVIGSSRRILFEGNAISQAGHSPFRLYPSGSNELIVIRGNVFHSGWGRNFELFTPRTVLFEKNVVTSALKGGRSNSTNAKLAVNGGIFRHNAVYRNWGGPLHLHGEDGHHADVQKLRLYHNVFYDNAEYGFAVSRQEARDIIFVNNIWAENDRHGGYVQVEMLSGRKAEHVRFLHNAFFAGETGRASISYGNMPFRVSQVEGPNWQLLNGEQFIGNLDADPLFNELHRYSFSLQEESPLIDAGTPLTRALGEGSGTVLPVEDAGYFYDGFGLIGEVGDLIAVGSPEQQARIVRIDYEANLLTLDHPVTWKDGDPVSLPWAGGAPDIGLYEHGDTGYASVQILTLPFNAAPNAPVELQLVLRNIPEPARAIWQLGDGTRAEGPKVTHRYSAPGEYPIRVKVTDAQGLEHRAGALVVVEEPREEGAPLLLSTFDADDEAWWRTWKTYRPAPADYRRELDPETGEGHLHVFAPEPGGKLPASVYPSDWNIDAYPIVEMRYRVDPGVSVGVFIEAFRTADRTRRIQVGTLTADGDWHELRIDARLIRVLFRDVEVLAGLHLEALRPPEAGKGYWLDRVVIRPEE